MDTDPRTPIDDVALPEPEPVASGEEKVESGAREAPVENVGRPSLFVGLLEILVLLGLAVATPTLWVGKQDELTGPILLAIGIVWGLYEQQGLAFAFRPRRKLRDAVQEAAERRAVTLAGKAHLPPGAAAALVAEVGGQERWAIPGWLSTGQGVLISLGLAGTFLGLTIGLLKGADSLGESDPSKMQEGMVALLAGAKLAFAKSLAGVLCGMVWTLRYRNLEVVHSACLDAERAWVESRYPVLSDQALLLRLHAEDRDAQSVLVQQLLAGLVGVQQAVAERVDEGAASVRASVEGLRTTVAELSEALPENIGDKTSIFLKPVFQDIQKTLAELASAGRTAIGDTLSDSMGQEVTGLRRSLAEVSRLLDDLGPRVDARIQEGAATAASALTEAGQRTSEEMRSAAAELTGGVAEIRDMAHAIRDTLAETQQIAGALRGAGEEVSTGLRGVADPLDRLPAALDGARAALVQAQEGFARGTALTGAQAERLQQLVQVTEEAATLQRAAAEEARVLAEQVERVRAACAGTIEALNASAVGQQAASAEAARNLVETVTAFQRTMEETQRAVAAASQSTFEGAQAVTLEAARRVAESLAQGAETFDRTLERLAAFGAESERSLEASRATIEAIGSRARELEDGVLRITQPFGEVAAALGQVGPEVREAAAAVNAERAALGSLGRELAGQANAVRLGQEALAQQVTDYRALQQLLSNEWAAHVRGVDQLLERIRQSWAAAVDAADSGLQRNAEQIATYAREVEKALRLPSDLRQLNEVLNELSDVLSELGQPRATA